MNNRINTVLENLSKSTFRNKFHLKEKEINYIKEKGIDKIQEHTKLYQCNGCRGTGVCFVYTACPVRNTSGN